MTRNSCIATNVILYSVHKGNIKKHFGSVYKFQHSINNALFKSDTPRSYMVDCSAKPGIIYGRNMWFEEDTSENIERVTEAFKEKYAAQINEYQKKITNLESYLASTWKVI